MKKFQIDEYKILSEPIQINHDQEIVDFDEFIFGANRRQIIEYLINYYLGKGWLLESENRIIGFVLESDGMKYHQIGPLNTILLPSNF